MRMFIQTSVVIYRQIRNDDTLFALFEVIYLYQSGSILLETSTGSYDLVVRTRQGYLTI